MKQLLVVRQMEVRTVERQVGVVEAREIARVERPAHLLVQLVHALDGPGRDALGHAAQRRRLEAGENLVDVPNAFQRERRDPYPAAVVDLDEALALEPQQRVAQRRAADPDARRQRVQVQLVAGAESPLVHQGAEVLVHLLAQ